MARAKGTLKLSSNIEPNSAAPLDARSLVANQNELLDAQSFPYYYIGMIVTVQNECTSYMLVSDDTTDPDSWKEVGSSQSQIVYGYYDKTNDIFYEDQAQTTAITPVSDVIYIDRPTDIPYLWNGQSYTDVPWSLSLGETSTTAYRGDRGKAAYDHSRVTEGNPHKVTAKDVGLDKVPNVATDDQTPTFIQAQTRENLSSGEKISVMLGKISKFFADLKDLAFIAKDGDSSTKYLKGDGTWATFPTLGTAAAKDYTNAVTKDDGDLVTSGAVHTAINNLPKPMIYKGTLGTTGTITELPAASADNEGFTYKVITAGTYESQAAKVGDIFISNGTTWDWVPSGDETDTWRNIKVNGTEKLASGISSGAVDFVNGDNTTVAFNATGNKVSVSVPSVSSSSAGVAPKGAAVSTQSQTTKFLREDGSWAAPSYTTNTNTTYTFVGGTNKFTVTPSGGTAQDVNITPSITNNVTGSGTSGSIAKFNGANTVTNGPAFGSDTTKFLRNDGTWQTISSGVTGVKGDSESSWRTGNVNITKENIGLSNVGNFKAVSTSSGQGLTTSEQANARTNINAAANTVATTSANGLMSSTDKTKVNGLTASDNVTFRFGKDSAGNYGYILNQGGADTVIPFKSGDINIAPWGGIANFDGNQVWTDGTDTYYSNGSEQYVLNKNNSATLTWVTKEWTGLTNFYGQYIWKDGANIYYSLGTTQYYLNDSSGWYQKTWSGLTNFNGAYIWTDGTTMYYSAGTDQYYLHNKMQQWYTQTWSGLTNFYGKYVWKYGSNTYFYSNGDLQYKLNGTTWSAFSWSGTCTTPFGSLIWTYGNLYYYSNGSGEQYQLRTTSTSHGIVWSWNGKTWNGLTDALGDYIWTDNVNTYYSRGLQQYIVSSSSSFTSWPFYGLNAIGGQYVWNDGSNIYYSAWDKQYVLNKSNCKWSVKTWTGLTNFYGNCVWTDGTNIYYSQGTDKQYVLDVANSTWSAKTWNNFTDISGTYIWTDGTNIYHSNSSNHYVLDKSNSTWNSKTWYGATNFYGENIWTDGTNVYLSNYANQYYLDKSTSTWTSKAWDGLRNFYGQYVWTDGKDYYYSNGSSHYILQLGTMWVKKYYSKVMNFYGTDVWTDGINTYCGGKYVFYKKFKEWIKKGI